MARASGEASGEAIGEALGGAEVSTSSSSSDGEASVDDDGDTQLHVLTVSDVAKLTAKLKKSKWRRRIDDANDESKTPLHLAVMAKMIDAIQVILEGKQVQHDH